MSFTVNNYFNRAILIEDPTVNRSKRLRFSWILTLYYIRSQWSQRWNRLSRLHRSLVYAALIIAVTVSVWLLCYSESGTSKENKYSSQDSSQNAFAFTEPAVEMNIPKKNVTESKKRDELVPNPLQKSEDIFNSSDSPKNVSVAIEPSVTPKNTITRIEQKEKPNQPEKTVEVPNLSDSPKHVSVDSEPSVVTPKNTLSRSEQNEKPNQPEKAKEVPNLSDSPKHVSVDSEPSVVTPENTLSRSEQNEKPNQPEKAKEVPNLSDSPKHVSVDSEPSVETPENTLSRNEQNEKPNQPEKAKEVPNFSGSSKNVIEPFVETITPKKTLETEKGSKTEQNDRPVFTGPTNARQLAVVESFKHAWKGYKKHAWGHNHLKPVSGTGSSGYSLGLTIVDSLDTAYIMGLTDEFEEGRQWIKDELIFNKVDGGVSLFGITIKVLGGLLTNYYFTQDQMFLNKAKDLGERLMVAFSTPSGIPYPTVYLSIRMASGWRTSGTSITSEVTTLQLEFRELSRTSGNPKFEHAVMAVSEKIHALPKKNGLVPIEINRDTGRFLSSEITLGARGDSYYEYLLTQWLQTGKTINFFIEDYKTAIEGVRDILTKRTSPNKYLFIGELESDGTFRPKMDHLACFLPGTLALGYANGLPDWHMKMAEELLYTCYLMYEAHPTFLAPEITYFNTAFEKHAKVPNGYTSLRSVKTEKPEQGDEMDSFFLSETIKYMYLLFSDDRFLIDLNKFVMNAGAHPLPIHEN